MVRIAFLCKRRYMSKDVILDRYARLYEIPYQLARLGHEVGGWCMSYHGDTDGEWMHDATPGKLHWRSRTLGALRMPALAAWPGRMLRELRAFRPDVIIGASDIPHVVLGAWLARRLRLPYMADLYDNFEGYAQARIPGFVPALRRAVRRAELVTTTSEPLADLVRNEYRAKGRVVAMPSSVDLSVFSGGDKEHARQTLGLPCDARLIGTAGGLYRDKGIVPLLQAWEKIRDARSDVHLVLAGPTEPAVELPEGARVHYLGQLAHAQVANLFRALDVGVISVLDTPFGRYSFPQKAYEMLACGLPVVASDVGAMSDLFAQIPKVLFPANNAIGLASTVLRQLDEPARPQVPIADWAQLIAPVESLLCKLAVGAESARKRVNQIT